MLIPLLNFVSLVNTLLPTLKTLSTTSVGFVDDTKILPWSTTTEKYCKKLEELHDICVNQAKKHVVKFAQEKYQPMHFTRARKKKNLQASFSIQEYLISPQVSLRVLGIYFDPKLS